MQDPLPQQGCYPWRGWFCLIKLNRENKTENIGCILGNNDWNGS